MPTIVITLPAELIINAMSAADIGYWASVPKGADHADVLKGTDFALVKPHEARKPLRLTQEGIYKALGIMATKYPWHYKNVAMDNADCETGDALIQLATMGEIVYG